MLRAPSGALAQLLCEKSRLLEGGDWSPFSLARFLLCGASSGGSLRVSYYVDPLRVRGGLGVVGVVPVPPLVRRGLRVTLRRVLPLLLAPERSDVEIVPGTSHLLVAAVVDEIGPEHPLTIADERVRAVPLVHARVRVEAVGDGVPWHLPAHPRLHALDVRLGP